MNGICHGIKNGEWLVMVMVDLWSFLKSAIHHLSLGHVTVMIYVDLHDMVKNAVPKFLTLEIAMFDNGRVSSLA